MPNGPKILIIIPAFNEEDSILDTVRTIQERRYDYIVINDGSTDSTLDVCHTHHLNVLDLPINLGIGGAIQAGHKYAKEHQYDIDIQFDGDGQHDSSYIAELIHAVEHGANLVIGSRFIDTDTSSFKSTFMRRIGIRWLSGLIRLTAGKRITDPTSGFRACDKKAIDLFCDSYPIDYPEPESIVEALKHGLSVKEVPVEMNERTGGTSSIKALASVYYIIKVTLSILIVSMTRRR